MPFDAAAFEFSEKSVDQKERRIYVCESGSICIEEKHFRRTLSPEEFIVLLRRIFQRTNGTNLNHRQFYEQEKML